MLPKARGYSAQVFTRDIYSTRGERRLVHRNDQSMIQKYPTIHGLSAYLFVLFYGVVYSSVAFSIAAYCLTDELLRTSCKRFEPL